MPAFDRLRAEYLDDDDFAALRQLLMKPPDAGVQVPGTGGLRKLRFRDRRRQKGKRKDETSDLTVEERAALKVRVNVEVMAKRQE